MLIAWLDYNAKNDDVSDITYQNFPNDHVWVKATKTHLDIGKYVNEVRKSLDAFLLFQNRLESFIIFVYFCLACWVAKHGFR